MVTGRSTSVLFQLELSDALRSRWFAFTGGVYGLVFAVFVWLGLRESSVMGFTGLSRVVLNMANAIVLSVPLVALVATCQAVVRARGSGFFELIFSQPVRRTDWFAAAFAARALVVLGPLAALFGVALLVSPLLDGGDISLLPVVGKSLLVTASLAWSFLGIGLWISAASRLPERATVLALLVWLTAGALHDFAVIGLLLQFRVPAGAVFALAAANPTEAARIAVLSSADPDLSVLGPVGFWLANALGPTRALLVGVLWPLALGTFGLWRARRRLLASDLVG
jgi:ABC-2 type transport system permease protein